MYHLFFIRCLKKSMVDYTYKILYCMLKALKMSAFFTTTLFIKVFLVFTTIFLKFLNIHMACLGMNKLNQYLL